MSNKNHPMLKRGLAVLYAKDVSEILGVGTTTAYKIIKRLNSELEEQGYLIIPGRVSAQYFNERIYTV